MNYEVCSLVRCELTYNLYLLLFKIEKFLNITSKRPNKYVSKEVNKRKFRKYNDLGIKKIKNNIDNKELL